MLPTILIALAVAVVILLVVVALQPAEYRVARSATIAAPPASVFAQVNDFHNWQGWSPWAKRDPAMRQTYEGAPAGTGAVYTWVGNREVGEGRMEVTESRPNDVVRIRLDFIKPFASTADTEFAFKPDGGNGTAVTWSMTGRKNFVTKALCLFVSMDRMIGRDFETGLAQMKSAAEAAR